MNNWNKKNIKLFVWASAIILLAYIVFKLTVWDYFAAAIKSPLEYAWEHYDFQIHANQYNDFYNANSGSIIRVWQPITSGSEFVGIVMDTKWVETVPDGRWGEFKVKWGKELKNVLVFKNVNEKWEDFSIDFSKDGKNGLGILDEDYLKDTWQQAASSLVSLFSILFMSVMLFYFLKMINGQWPGNMKMEDIVKVRRSIWPGKSAFDLIWGINSQKEELRQIVKDINNWNKFKEAWVRNVRGMLFFWPPGVGKTMIARAIAIDANIEFFSVNAASMRSAFYWQSAKNVKKTIDMVKKFTSNHKNNLWILFIDEIDTLLKSRKNNQIWGHGEDDSIVNTFLSEMDSIEGWSNVIIIGATNFQPSDLDEAAMSRFDKKMFFNLPNLEERKDIIHKIIDNYENPKGKEIISTKNISVDNFARKMPGGSGRDIETIVNEAIRKSISLDRPVDDQIIHNEIATLALWPENKSYIIPEDRFEAIVYHELGHAYIGKRNGKIAETVTIIPRWPSLGTAWLLEKDDNVLKTQDEILHDIQELVAGRQSEKIFCNIESTGASNDYERAKALALAYVSVYNFEYKGERVYAATQNIDKLPERKQEEIHDIAKKIISDQEEIVYNVLIKHRESIHKSFELLKERETIGNEDIYIQPLY